MPRGHALLAVLLAALAAAPAPSVSLYTCRVDGTTRAHCCCSGETPMAEDSCCDVQHVETTAIAFGNRSASPVLDLHFQPAPDAGAQGPASQGERSSESALCQPPDGDPPPRPRSLFSIQRI